MMDSDVQPDRISFCTFSSTCSFFAVACSEVCMPTGRVLQLKSYFAALLGLVRTATHPVQLFPEF